MLLYACINGRFGLLRCLRIPAKIPYSTDTSVLCRVNPSSGIYYRAVCGILAITWRYRITPR
jgi:hypothetical protein